MKIVFNPSRVSDTCQLSKLTPGIAFCSSDVGIWIRANLPKQIKSPGNPSDIGCFSLVDGKLGWYAPDTQVKILDAVLQVYANNLKE